MAQSTFYHVPDALAIDGSDPTHTYGSIQVGIVDVGGSKVARRRSIVAFDVFGAAAEGRALRAGDTITAAELLLEVTGIVGTSGVACVAERVTRADWDYLTGTWNQYKAGNNWTTAGGDVSTPWLGYTGPTALGAYTIAGALACVTDAIASRGGLVHLRLMLESEAAGFTRTWTAIAAGSDSLRARLRVTYTAADPLPVAEWVDDAGAAHGAPAARAERAATPAPPARASRAGR